MRLDVVLWHAFMTKYNLTNKDKIIYSQECYDPPDNHVTWFTE